MRVQYKQLLTGISAVMLVIANIMATKIITVPLPIIGAVTVSAGVFPIAIVFLSTDTISEIYGKRAAYTAVVTMVSALILSWMLLRVSVLLPRSGGVSQSAYSAVIGASLPIVIASVVTSLLSQSLDVTVFHKIRNYTGVKYKWVRNITSTSISQFIDTAAFTVLAFAVLPTLVGGTTLSVGVITSIIAAEYAVKMGLAAIDTPLFYLFTRNTTEYKNE